MSNIVLIACVVTGILSVVAFTMGQSAIAVLPDESSCSRVFSKLAELQKWLTSLPIAVLPEDFVCSGVLADFLSFTIT